MNLATLGKGMRLVDIAIVSARPRQGLSTQVVQAFKRLYRQLGFAVMNEDSLRRQMVWDGTRFEKHTK